MNRRMFIDTVRQFKVLSLRKNKSYAAAVAELRQMYLDSVAQDGAGDAEREKEAAWSGAFIEREYTKFDRNAEQPASG